MPRGARQLPAECWRRLEAADLILHAGDFVSSDFYRELRRLGPLEAVHGNMDDDELMRTLPPRRVVEVEEVRIGLVHEPAKLAGLEGCHALVYGHTHMPLVSREGGTLLLNPGSPTERRRAPARSMLLLTIDGNRIRTKLVKLT
jgi:putative phosphoesterase